MVYVRRTAVPAGVLRGEKQRALYAAIGADFSKAADAFAESGAGSTQLKALRAAGLVELRTETVYRNPYADLKIDERRENKLSAHQTAAYDRLCAL